MRLKAPPGVSQSTIDGHTYTVGKDGAVAPQSPAHAAILRQHGYTDPTANAAASATAPAPATAKEAPAYFTGPYTNHLAWLRENGVEVANDAADSVVLGLTEGLHRRYIDASKPKPVAPEESPVAPKRRTSTPG